MKVSELATYTPTHVLVEGDPSSGKSTLVSQLAEKGWKLIWISMDNGHSILKKLSPAAQDRIELVILPDTRDYPVAVDTCRKLLEMNGPSEICNTHGKIGCSVCKKAGAGFTVVPNFRDLPRDTIVVWDNISQLSDSYLSLICKGKPVDYKLQLDDWGSLRFHLLKALTDFQQAPYNLVAICHCVEEETVDKQKKIMPAVGSSTFSPKVGGYFDHVVYCHVMNMAHKFGSMSTYKANVITKSRTDVAIEKMKVADLAPFFDGTIPVPEKHGAAQVAEVAALVPEKKVEAPAPVKEAEVVGFSVGQQITGVKSGVVIAATPTPAQEEPKSQQPQAGQATSMHSSVPASDSPADRAKAILAGLRRG